MGSENPASFTNSIGPHAARTSPLLSNFPVFQSGQLNPAAGPTQRHLAGNCWDRQRAGRQRTGTHTCASLRGLKASDRPPWLSLRMALSAGKEQPIGLLLVDQVVVIGNRLDADLLEDRAKCIRKR